jgi:hypothetical protein
LYCLYILTVETSFIPSIETLLRLVCNCLRHSHLRGLTLAADWFSVSIVQSPLVPTPLSLRDSSSLFPLRDIGGILSLKARWEIEGLSISASISHSSSSSYCVLGGQGEFMVVQLGL